MAIADKVLKALSEYGDDVVRAGSEFGDDAVESVLRLNPAMRKRLAALVEKRVASSAGARAKKEMSVNPRTGRASRAIFSGQEDIESKAMQRIRDYGINDESPMDYLGPSAKPVDRDIYEFADIGDGLRDFASRFRGASSWKDEASAIDRLALRQKNFRDMGYGPEVNNDYQDTVLSIASGTVPDKMNNAIAVGKRLNDLMQAAYPDPTQRAVRDAADLVLDADVPAMLSQMQLLNLLRKIGGTS